MTIISIDNDKQLLIQIYNNIYIKYNEIIKIIDMKQFKNNIMYTKFKKINPNLSDKEIKCKILTIHLFMLNNLNKN
jgi:hypothetical protein